ncbi:3-deoxy-7-phosphoheptulonate synthase [Oceanirhabdus sp. W0125-5]|uniref:3-deoxy-7-phosphoheptulonate synthase n=1 Tax=Oceanirhabdus sp. W0125-5 TaxID=2999116 RepID=UPI0022F2AE42|nr:3-deoxy-7-phosphoheptulonate synthase [Oceanirhabdus sp. W0125-5]WBW95345.1 3-deoxy-7-phosphoheptulonate synthase [Oceanirhabdus sp. W0125-5]
MTKLLIDKTSGEDIKFTIGKDDVEKVAIGDKKVIISGPCSVEDIDTMRSICKRLKEIGVHILRGGAFKPRTSPYDFQGLGEEGVKILHEVSRENKMPFVTEVMDARHIELIEPYADMLQIGSRNMYNYTLLKEVGKLDIPIILKRGMSATLSEWLLAAEYILKEGNEKVIMCERGIRTFENYTRNTLDLNSVAVIKNKYRLPVIVDPSHGTGLRELVSTMSLSAIATGCDGLIIESHTHPDNAVSDARQTISIETLKDLNDKIKLMETILGN